MAYIYQDIWNTVKANGKAEITVSEVHAPTVIQGVRRTKSFENGLKRKKKKVRFPKMYVARKELGQGMLLVTFTLSYEVRL